MNTPNENPLSGRPVEGELFEPQADLRQTLQVFLDKAWIILLCMVFTTLAAAIYLKRAPRIYRATATVQVEQQEQKVVKIEQVLQEDLRGQEILNTIVQKLRSRPLLARVLVTNHLAAHPRFLGKTQAGLTNVEDLVSRLEPLVKTTLRRNTRLIDVTVSHAEPEMAALIANSIVGEFVILDYELRTSSTRGAFGFLKDEADRLKRELEISESELQKYREQVGSVSVEQSQDSFLPKLQQYNVRLTQAKADSLKLRALYEQISALTNKLDALLVLPQIAIEPGVADARTAYARAESDLATVRLRYKNKHPKFILATQQVEQSRNTLIRAALGFVETSRMAYEVALLTEQSLEKALKQAEQDALHLSGQAIQFNILSRELDSKRALLASVLNRLQETSISSDPGSDKIRIVEPAHVPESPASPRTSVILALAVLAGLVMGSMAGLVLNAFDLSLRSVDDAERYLKLPVLTTIPRLKRRRSNVSRLVVAEAEMSAGAESFRALRTALSMLGHDSDHRTILFTSALPQEGKSFTAANLGAALAQQGLRTVIVDADLRRPSVESYLTGETTERPGVTDFLTGHAEFAAVVHSLPDHPLLSWIPAGTTAPNPAELLARHGLGDLLAAALLQFDRVVVDSAPIHAVSDTLSIARQVQTVVLVVHGNKTPRRPVLRAIHLLEKAGARMGGVVLNLLPQRRGAGYYSYDTYYYHGGYGSEKNGNSRPKRRHQATPAHAGLPAEPLRTRSGSAAW